MTRTRARAIGFGLVALLCLIAAVMPALRGGTMNTVFLGVAVVFFVLALAVGRKAGKASGSPGA